MGSSGTPSKSTNYYYYYYYYFLPFSWCPAFDFPGLLLPGAASGCCSEDYLGSPWRRLTLLCYPAPRAALNFCLPDAWTWQSDSLALDQPTVGLTVAPDSPVESGWGHHLWGFDSSPEAAQAFLPSLFCFLCFLTVFCLFIFIFSPWEQFFNKSPMYKSSS